MEKISFQEYLRSVIPNAPPPMPHTRFVSCMGKLTDEKAAEFYKLYRDASIRGLIKRDYQVRNRIYDSRPDQLANKRARSRNRRLFEKEGLVKKGDNTEIHHIDGDPKNNDRSNLAVVPVAHHRCHHNPEAKSCDLINNREQQKRVDRNRCLII